MAKEIFLISDLHIGGDGPLDHCDFEKELISFLKHLENYSGDAELVIVGDAFGLWEFTQLKGIEKMHKLVSTHKELFEQFRKTGRHTPITLIPGNHDYELACYPEFVPFLKDYGIILEQKIAITREIAGKTIWIEHGNQHDSFNAFEHFGDPGDTPIGYYVTAQFVSGASEISKHGKQNWLKDIQAVYPTEHIPHWMFSNYYYREMSPILRYMLVPFLVLFSISIIVAVIALAEEWGLMPTTISQLDFLRQVGGVGALIGVVITVNSSIISFLLLLAIPLYFIYRDVKATLARYHLTGYEDLASEKEENYVEAARKVFKDDPNVAVFVYGHTHNVSLTVEKERAIINTGTWLKTLTRVSTLSRFMPDVYVPSYFLNYFKLYEEEGQVAIKYHRVPKESKSEMTMLQRVMTITRLPSEKKPIPEKTTL